jgi:hypothetical protein
VDNETVTRSGEECREALIAAVRALAPAWNDTLEQHWRTAITAIIVPMLEGAALDSAVWAERLAAGVSEIDRAE